MSERLRDDEPQRSVEAVAASRRCPCSASHAPDARSSPRRATIRSSTPGASIVQHRLPRAHLRIEQRLRTVPERLLEPSTQSAGVGIRSTCVRPPSAAATASIRGKRGRSISSPSRRYERCQAGSASRSNVSTTTGPRATRRSSARPASGGSQWWIVMHAIARVERAVVERQPLGARRQRGRGARAGAERASRRSARPPAPSGPQARRSPRPRRRSRTVAASPSAAWMRAAMRGSARRRRA